MSAYRGLMDRSTIATSIGLPVAAAALGSVATRTGMRSRWYRRLDKPRIQPPPAVFPVVWTALYAQTAVASAQVQKQMTPVQAQTYRRRLALNMALNAGWCWVFFRGQRLVPSIAVAAGLTASTVDLARAAGRTSRPAGWLLAPYALWNAFATVLTTAIWRRNR